MINPRNHDELDFDRLQRGFAYTSILEIPGSSTVDSVALFINEGAHPVRLSNLSFGALESSNVEVTWKIYTAPTILAKGTHSLSINRNAIFATAPNHAPGASLYVSPTISVDGILVESLSTSKHNKVQSSELKAVMAPGSSYFLKKTSGNLSGKSISLRVDWNER